MLFYLLLLFKCVGSESIDANGLLDWVPKKGTRLLKTEWGFLGSKEKTLFRKLKVSWPATILGNFFIHARNYSLASPLLASASTQRQSKQ